MKALIIMLIMLLITLFLYQGFLGTTGVAGPLILTIDNSLFGPMFVRISIFVSSGVAAVVTAAFWVLVFAVAVTTQIKGDL